MHTHTNPATNPEEGQMQDSTITDRRGRTLRVGMLVQVDVYPDVRTGYITKVLENVKNGRPGIDYTVNGRTYWAYADQVI